VPTWSGGRQALKPIARTRKIAAAVGRLTVLM
jgi:hypothetical protein